MKKLVSDSPTSQKITRKRQKNSFESSFITVISKRDFDSQITGQRPENNLGRLRSMNIPGCSFNFRIPQSLIKYPISYYFFDVAVL